MLRPLGTRRQTSSQSGSPIKLIHHQAGGGKIAGKTVTFAPIAKLAPKEVVTYTISAKGMSTGDHRLKVDLTSDVLSEPVTHEESTHVY